MLSDLLTFSIQNGLPEQTVLLLLLLPALAALVIFFRVVVGMGELQMHRGIFLALGVGLLGIKYGLFIFFVTLFFDALVNYVLGEERFLPPAKHAISLFFVSLIVLAALILAGYFTKSVLIVQDTLLILFVVVSSQGLLQFHLGDHPLKPFTWLLGMAAFLYLGFLLVSSPVVHAFILRSTLLYLGILLTLLFLLARFKGLRFAEYIRFYKVITRS